PRSLAGVGLAAGIGRGALRVAGIPAVHGRRLTPPCAVRERFATAERDSEERRDDPRGSECGPRRHRNPLAERRRGSGTDRTIVLGRWKAANLANFANPATAAGAD